MYVMYILFCHALGESTRNDPTAANYNSGHIVAHYRSCYCIGLSVLVLLMYSSPP